jgi:membrane associated rhomboid family serine protease
MNKKLNGSGSDHSDAPEEKLVQFPSLAERDRIRKAKQKAQQKLDKEMRRKAQPPFLNLSKVPPFTRALVAAFVLVHIALQFVSQEALYKTYMTLGFVPGNFTGATGPFQLLALLSPITYLFIHGNWTHLAFNVLMTFAMGTFFEREFGARATAFLFFACGIIGAIVCLALNLFSTSPVIGASGGISGLFGAVTILLFQRGAGGPFAHRGPWPLIAFWVVLMIGTGLLSGDALAWQAHVGGFLAGIGLLRLIQTGKIKSI